METFGASFSCRFFLACLVFVFVTESLSSGWCSFSMSSNRNMVKFSYLGVCLNVFPPVWRVRADDNGCQVPVHVMFMIVAL